MPTQSDPIPLPGGLDQDDDRQDKFDILARELGQVRGLVFAGTGAPAHTPVGPQLYLRIDGGAGTTLYVYEPTPAAWNPLS